MGIPKGFKHTKNTKIKIGLASVTHGYSGTITYISYNKMKSRVKTEDDKSKYYKMKIQQEWLGKNGFINFLKDIGGERPSKKYSLDRINNDMGYIKGNVRWATRSEQNSNRGKITFDEQARLNIKNALKGRVVTEDWKKNISNGMKKLRQKQREELSKKDFNNLFKNKDKKII